MLHGIIAGREIKNTIISIRTQQQSPLSAVEGQCDGQWSTKGATHRMDRSKFVIQGITTGSFAN